MKKIIALMCAALLVVPMFAAKKTKVGISLPTKSLQRWNQDGDNMKAAFEKAGYTVDLQYGGDNDVPTQIAQIENMITGKCDVLVICAIDGESLSTVLEQARKKKISVIAYDRLIRNTKAVTYYASFDNYKVGQIQGQYLEDKLNLKTRTKDNPAYIECFTGDPGDNNATFFFNGAMDVLNPYLASGALVCRSGQTSFAQCATEGWSTEKAQARMENLITSNKYGPKGTKLDAVLSSNDSCANGITNALKNVGYTKANFPIITGQDCDVVSMKNMVAGTQAMSIFKDTRKLADAVVEMVSAVMQNKKPKVNNTTDYDNGVIVVPSYLLVPVPCDLSNYKKLLIDDGYYTEAQLK